MPSVRSCSHFNQDPSAAALCKLAPFRVVWYRGQPLTSVSQSWVWTCCFLMPFNCSEPQFLVCKVGVSMLPCRAAVRAH